MRPAGPPKDGSSGSTAQLPTSVPNGADGVMLAHGFGGLRRQTIAAKSIATPEHRSSASSTR